MIYCSIPRLILLLAASLPLIQMAQAQPAASAHNATKADVDKWMKDLSNWGRWGKDDQIGAVNLITPAKRKQAAALVTEGYSVSLARLTEMDKAVDNENPFKLEMNWTGANSPGQFSLDTLHVLYHGFAHTHMDALCHMFYQGKMFNGISKDVVTNQGSSQLGVQNFKNGIFTRGILIDIPALKGVPYLEPKTPIYPEDLDAWEKKAGVKVGSGDVIFIRTGRWARRAAKGPWNVGEESAGLHASTMKWVHDRDVAMVGSDAASDVMPSMVDGVVQPIHQLLLISMGVAIFDNCDLEAISAEAAKRKRWAFLLTASPIPVNHGTGSPLNPIATF
jgi:kynurenine formamidase